MLSAAKQQIPRAIALRNDNSLEYVNCTASRFENHLRNRLLGSVRERKRHIRRSQPCGKLGCLAVESDRGPASRLARNFNVAPAHAMVPSGTESFHAGFLGGEAGSVAFHTIGFRVAIADLTFGKDAMEETVAVAGQGLRDSRNLGNVDPGADNHEEIR